MGVQILFELGYSESQKIVESWSLLDSYSLRVPSTKQLAWWTILFRLFWLRNMKYDWNYSQKSLIFLLITRFLLVFIFRRKNLIDRQPQDCVSQRCAEQQRRRQPLLAVDADKYFRRLDDIDVSRLFDTDVSQIIDIDVRQFF